MTPKQQQKLGEIRDTNSTAEFTQWLPSPSSTLPWEGMSPQGLTPLIFLFPYGLHFPAHDTRHGETPLDGICQQVEQWNPHFNWTPPALLPKITEITGGGGAGMWSQMFHRHPLFFSVRGNFSMQFQPWSTRGAGNDLSSPFHPKSFPDCALGMLKFTTFGTGSRGLVKLKLEFCCPWNYWGIHSLHPLMLKSPIAWLVGV